MATKPKAKAAVKKADAPKKADAQAAAQEAMNQMRAGIDLCAHSGLVLLEKLADMRIALNKDGVNMARVNQDLDDANVAFEQLNKVLDGLAEWCGTLETRLN